MYRSLKFFFHPSLVSLLLPIAALILLLTPLKLVSLCVGIYLITILTRKFQTTTLGFITRFIVVGLLVACGYQVVSLFFWLAHIIVPVEWMVGLLLLFLGYLLIRRTKPLDYSFKTTQYEVIALLLSIGSVALIVFGAFHNTPLSSGLWRLMTRGFDSATHLSLAVSVYENGGYLYGPINQVHDKLVYTSLSGYPEGWHLATAAFWKLLPWHLDTSSTKQIFSLYIGVLLAWYAALIYLCNILLVSILDLVARKSNRDELPVTATAAIMIAFTYIAQVAIILSLLRYGFVNFIALICYIIGLWLFSSYYITNKINTSAYTGMGSLLVAGASLTWLLAMPILFVMLLATLLAQNGKKLFTTLTLRPLDIIMYIIVAAAAVATVAQGLIQMRYSTIPDNINADTVIWSFSQPLALLSLIVIAFAAIKLYSHQTRSYVAVPLVSAGVITAIIFTYQYMTAGKTGYYFEKIASVMTIFMIIGIFQALVVMLSKSTTLYKNWLAFSTLVLSLAFMIPFVCGVNLQELRFVLGRDRPLDKATALALESVTKTRPSNNVYVLRSVNYEEDVIATHTVNALSRSETKCSSKMGWAIMMRDPDLIRHLRDCIATDTATTYYIITSGKTDNFYRVGLDALPNVKFVLVN